MPTSRPRTPVSLTGLMLLLFAPACAYENSSRLDELEAQVEELLSADSSSPQASTTSTSPPTTVTTEPPQQQEPSVQALSSTVADARQELAEVLAAYESETTVQYGLAANTLHAVVHHKTCLDSCAAIETWGDTELWVFDTDWTRINIRPDIYAYSVPTVRFFDVTGNGAEDIVISYFAGKRMGATMLTNIDGSWVDAGTAERPQFAAPGLMSTIHQSCDPSCAEGADIIRYWAWANNQWTSCDELDFLSPCDRWSGG